ncbi:putative oligopeptide transporter, partial [Aureobasidium melanogenum]
MPLNIAIIGAGPIGCTLAHLILKSPQFISVTIFEGEASSDTRSQGGTLDLHDESGLLAIKKAGLYEKFLEHARFDGEAIIISDKRLKRYINMGGSTKESNRGRPEIDRPQLRKLLLDNLPEGVVKWGHRLQSITTPAERSQPTDITLNFEHASLSGFDLIVGADGANSRIRPLVTDVQPHFSAVTAVRFGVSDVATRAPELHTLVNKGSLFAISDHKALMAQQLGDGSLSVYAMLVPPSADWLKTSPYDTNDMKLAKPALLEEFKNWHPQLKSIIENADHGLWASNLDMLPVGTTWEHRPGVTLVGDAAHLMTPFAGEGVNLGLADTVSLASAIESASSSSTPSTSLSSAVKSYESGMFIRAKQCQDLSYRMMKCILFKPNAPEATIEEYAAGALETACPGLLYPIAKLAINAYFLYFRAWHRFWNTEQTYDASLSEMPSKNE